MSETDLINEILKTNLPRSLFHYTSPTGLAGILENKQIWTTKIYYLNDNSELSLALNYFQQEIEMQKSNVGKTRTDEELSAMKEALTGLGTINVAVASFTAMGDQLSQWRGYCEVGKGYSLGFNGSKLKEWVDKAKGYHLVPCVYEEQEHRKIAKEFIDLRP